MYDLSGTQVKHNHPTETFRTTFGKMRVGVTMYYMAHYWKGNGDYNGFEVVREITCIA